MNPEHARMNPQYSRYHPKWYRRRVPILWWKENPAYIKFISRELTSVFVAYSAVVLLLQLWAAARGAAAYDQFVSWLRSPAVVVVHVVVLLSVLFHSITWLSLAPKALVVRLGKRKVPDAVVLIVHYAAWLGATGLVAWTLLVR